MIKLGTIPVTTLYMYTLAAMTEPVRLSDLQNLVLVPIMVVHVRV